MPVRTHYIDRDVPDASGITLLQKQAAADHSPIPASRPPLHCHAFYELVLVLRGSAELFTGQGQFSLIPGDLLLLPPDRPHAYILLRGAQAGCCRFEADSLSGALAASLHDMVYWNTPKGKATEKRLPRAARLRERGACGGRARVAAHERGAYAGPAAPVTRPSWTRFTPSCKASARAGGAPLRL